MFCSGCGTQIQTGLNYCSRCGRRVAEDAQPGKPWRSPLAMAGNVAAVGFVGYIFVLLVLTKSGTLPNVFIPITFFYFAALFGICRMIMRSGATSPLRGLGSNSDDAATRPPTYLSPVTTSQLEEARQFGVGSVTDATTRTLDKLPVEERRN